MDEEDWRQILFDFRWSARSRGHWLARFGHQKLVFLCLRLLSSASNGPHPTSRAARSKLDLARDLVVFLEENFARLATLDQDPPAHRTDSGAAPQGEYAAPRLDQNQQKSVLFAICETLNAIIVAPGQNPKCRRESLQLRCQAVSSLTVILVTCNAHGTYRRLLSSFVRLLLGIVARIGAQSDQQLRLVACESLRVLEREHPEASFVAPAHILSHCECEATSALQGYLCLLASVFGKRSRAVRDGGGGSGGGEIEEAESAGRPSLEDETRQAAVLLLERLEVLSPAMVLGASGDFLSVARAARINQRDLWASFYSLLHVLNPLLLSQVLASCAGAGYEVTARERLDAARALVASATHNSVCLPPSRTRQCLGKALWVLAGAAATAAASNAVGDFDKEAAALALALFPNGGDPRVAVSCKLHACLRLVRVLERGGAGGAGAQDLSGALLGRLERFWGEQCRQRRSEPLVAPIYRACRDFLREDPACTSASLAREATEILLDSYPEPTSRCLDAQLSASGRGCGFLHEAAAGLLRGWLPHADGTSRRDAALVRHYLPCLHKLLSSPQLDPRPLLSILLNYVRRGLMGQGEWAELGWVLRLVRQCLRHHATSVRALRDDLAELLVAISERARDPDTKDQCRLYSQVVASPEATKLCLLMFDADAPARGKAEGSALKGQEGVKRNLFRRASGGLAGATASVEAPPALVTDFWVELGDGGEGMECVLRSENPELTVFSLDLAFACESENVAIEGVHLPVASSGAAVRLRPSVSRPLPATVEPRATYTDAEGRSWSGALRPISLGFEHFVSLGEGEPKWARPPVKCVKKLERGKVGGRSLLLLPPKFHVLLSQEEETGECTIETDFWPALEYIDDYLESL